MTNAITRESTFSPDLIDELHGFARRLAGNDSDAWDLVQDTLERALRKWPAGITREAAGPWFRVVMKNRHLDLVRSSGRRTLAKSTPDAIDHLMAPEPVEMPMWRRVDPEEVRNALPKLCAEQRQVLVMQWHEAMSLRDIASTLGVPQATVGVRAFRGRKSLRRILLDEPRTTVRESSAPSPRRRALRASARQDGAYQSGADACVAAAR